MERYTFEVFERDEGGGISFFDVKVIKADSFGEAQEKFDKKYGRCKVTGHIYSNTS